MFCTKCGLKNEDDAIFCAGCGAKIIVPKSMQTDAQTNVMSNVEPVVDTPSETEEMKEDKTEKDVSLQTAESVEEQKSAEDIGYSFFQQEEQYDDTEAQNNPSEKAEEAANEVEEERSEPVVESVAVQQEAQNADEFQNIEPQTSNFNTMEQPFQNQNFNPNLNQNTYSGVSSDIQAVPKNKFSVKRFIFSALLMIAAIVSCIGIVFKYVEIKVHNNEDGMKTVNSQSFKGYEIIKDDDFIIDFSGSSSDVTDDIAEVMDEIRLVVIISAVALIIFAVIEFVLLIAVRRRWGYVLSMLFSMIGLALSGGTIYLWCFEFLDELKELYQMMLYASSLYADFSVKITANIGMGLIMTIAAQAVALICSIVLMTCKNRPKVQKNIY